MASTSIGYRVRGPVDDVALSALHAEAFGGAAAGGGDGSAGPAPVLPWDARLHRHSLTWVEAYAVGPPDGTRLVGFVNVAWDGGTHAFLLDTCVAPERQGEGIGAALVRRAVEAAREAGCGWLHVDCEPAVAPFYARCGFGPTEAGLLRLRP